MKKHERISRLLTAQCARCGTCCRKPLVGLTHHDLHRLVEATGSRAAALVKFCSPAEIEADPDDADWVYLAGGRRMMCLRQKDDRCIFLKEDSTCAVYEARPAPCRTFPIDVDFDEEGNLTGARLIECVPRRVVRCRCTYGNDEAREGNLRFVRRANAEYESYADLVERWNDAPRRGTARQFLAFLGF